MLKRAHKIKPSPYTKPLPNVRLLKTLIKVLEKVEKLVNVIGIDEDLFALELDHIYLSEKLKKEFNGESPGNYYYRYNGTMKCCYSYIDGKQKSINQLPIGWEDLIEYDYYHLLKSKEELKQRLESFDESAKLALQIETYEKEKIREKAEKIKRMNKTALFFINKDSIMQTCEGCAVCTINGYC